ncbi:MAG TPA: hypothetical protein VLG16_03380 [Candidatus Saccharimonadales bacterium]|nr:hypothetical protein [Candidatus Saccharimonadales bacterium]
MPKIIELRGLDTLENFAEEMHGQFLWHGTPVPPAVMGSEIIPMQGMRRASSGVLEPYGDRTVALSPSLLEPTERAFFKPKCHILQLSGVIWPRNVVAGRANHKTANVITITTDRVMKALFSFNAEGHVYGAATGTAQPVTLETKSGYGDWDEYISYDRIPIAVHASFGFDELRAQARHIIVVLEPDEAAFAEVESIAEANPQWDPAAVIDHSRSLGMLVCSIAEWEAYANWRTPATV